MSSLSGCLVYEVGEFGVAVASKDEERSWCNMEVFYFLEGCLDMPSFWFDGTVLGSNGAFVEVIEHWSMNGLPAVPQAQRWSLRFGLHVYRI
jgi:hypothetical protein